MHLAAGPHTQKAQNLARDPRLTVTTGGEGFDVVIEGAANRVHEDAALAGVARAYVSKYGWEVEAQEGSLHGEGAPTAGPPPYHVYRLTPHRAFGFAVTGHGAPTRWLFRSSGPPTTARSASELIDARIAELADWRGETLAHSRALILEADPNVVESVKWRKPSNPGGVPAWEVGGIICTCETYADRRVNDGKDERERSGG